MLTLTNISQSFSGRLEPVLKNIQLHLIPGDFCVLIGSNGSGKSTLLNLISGDNPPDTGRVMIQHHDVTHKNRSHAVAYVSQDVNKGTIPEMTLLENMTLSSSRAKKTGLSLYHRLANNIFKDIQSVGMGLEAHLHTPLCQLSGGQRQLIATLMAVTSNPDLLLLDEHTSALDPVMQQTVMAYTAKAMATRSLTGLMVTHNLSDALTYGNRLIMMHQGQIVFDVSGKAKSSLNMASVQALFHKHDSQGSLQ